MGTKRLRRKFHDATGPAPRVSRLYRKVRFEGQLCQRRIKKRGRRVKLDYVHKIEWGGLG